MDRFNRHGGQTHPKMIHYGGIRFWLSVSHEGCKMLVGAAAANMPFAEAKKVK